MLCLLYIFVTMMPCFGLAVDPIRAACNRDLCLDEKLRAGTPVTAHGFVDYSDVTFVQDGSFLTSLLDSAPCPPPWKTELLCSQKFNISCQDTVPILDKCVKEIRRANFPHCQVLSVCESVLKCAEFSVFSHDILECRVPEEVSQHVTKSPTTQLPKTTVPPTKPRPTTNVNTPHQTRYGGTSGGAQNSSILISVVLNDTLNTVAPPKAVKPPEGGSSGGTVLAVVIVIIILLLLCIAVLVFIVYRRKKNYKVTRRQWSADSRSPLTKTEDGYDICCYHWKRRDTTTSKKKDTRTNKNGCYNSVAQTDQSEEKLELASLDSQSKEPLEEELCDSQSKDSLERVLDGIQYADEEEVKNIKDVNSEESEIDKVEESVVTNNQTTCDNQTKNEARESLEEEKFPGLHTPNLGALRKNISSEDEGFSDLQNGNESVEYVTEQNK